MSTIPITSLPINLQLIAEITSVEAAMKLGKHSPRKLYIPRSWRADHPIPQLIGEEFALKLSARFGGEQLNSASCAQVQRQVRCRRMTRDHKNKGLTTAQLAEKYGVSLRTAQVEIATGLGGADRRKSRPQNTRKGHGSSRMLRLEKPLDPPGLGPSSRRPTEGNARHEECVELG